MFRSAWGPFLLRSAALAASPRSLRRVVPVAKQLASIHPGVSRSLTSKSCTDSPRVRLENTSECPYCIPSFPQLSDSPSCSGSSTTHPSEMIFCRTKSGALRQPHTKPAGIDRDCRYSTRSALPEGWRSGGCARGSSARRSSPPSRSRMGLRFTRNRARRRRVTGHCGATRMPFVSAQTLSSD
jgi:hypothetical protein